MKSKVKEATNNTFKSKVYEKNKSHVSGPAHDHSYKDFGEKQKEPFYGSLITCLLKTTKRGENEIPYMRLKQ